MLLRRPFVYHVLYRVVYFEVLTEARHDASEASRQEADRGVLFSMEYLLHCSL